MLRQSKSADHMPNRYRLPDTQDFRVSLFFAVATEYVCRSHCTLLVSIPVYRYTVMFVYLSCRHAYPDMKCFKHIKSGKQQKRCKARARTQSFRAGKPPISMSHFAPGRAEETSASCISGSRKQAISLQDVFACSCVLSVPQVLLITSE